MGKLLNLMGKAARIPTGIFFWAIGLFPQKKDEPLIKPLKEWWGKGV